ncbi:MAG: hypothetical protein RR751_01950 [Clostridia bacterium]
MNKLKIFIINHRYYFISLILLLLIDAINISYELKGCKLLRPYANYIISFFFQFTEDNIGIGFSVVRILIIMFGSTYEFYNEISSGLYKNILSKIAYRKYMFKNICKCFLKSILLKPFTSIIVLVYLFLKLPINFSDMIIGIDIEPLSKGELINGFLITIAIQIVVSMLLTSITIICIKLFKKYYMVISSAYFIFEICDVFIDNLIINKIIYALDTSNLFDHRANHSMFIGIFNSYPMKDDVVLLIAMSIQLITSFLICYIIYRNKESLVLSNE